MATKTLHGHDCPHCLAYGSVRRPSRLWWVAVAASWLMLGTAVMLASLIGPFILFVGPVLALSGAGLLSFVHGKASEPPTCDACGKIAVPLSDARVVEETLPAQPVDLLAA